MTHIKKPAGIICIILLAVMVIIMMPVCGYAASFSQDATVSGKKHALYKPDMSVSSYQPDEIRLYTIDGSNAYCVECGLYVGSGYAAGVTLAEACASGSLETAAYNGGHVATSSLKAEKWVAYCTYIDKTLGRADIAMGVWLALEEAFPVAGSYTGYDAMMNVWNAFSTWYSTADAAYYGSNTRLYVAGADNQTLCVFAPYALPKSGSLEIYKKSADEKFTAGNSSYSLKGAVFTVYGADGTQAVQVTTDENGRAYAESITAGTYTVKETAAPQGYVLNHSEISVTVEAGKTATVSMADEPVRGNIKIVKKSSRPSVSAGNSYYSLEGCRFAVISSSGKTAGTVTTDEKGTAVLSGIPLGKYTVRELKAPAGFEKNTEDVNVTAGSSKTVSVTVSDRPVTGSITVHKKSSAPGITDGNTCYTCAGCEFAVRNERGNIVGTMITDADGTAVMEDLPLGEYTVQEIHAPSGYGLDTAVMEAEVTQTKTDAVLYVSDSPCVWKPSLVISKTDSENEGGTSGDGTLEGALFEIDFYAGQYDTVENLPENPDRTWVFKTDENGEIYFDESCFYQGDSLFYDSEGNAVLPLGTAVIYEIRPPEGYVLSREVKIMNITYDEENLIAEGFEAAVFGNGIIKGKIRITKKISETDVPEPVKTAMGLESEAPEQNAIFLVYLKSRGSYEDALKSEKAIISTDRNGNAETGELPYGVYTVHQLIGLKGYSVHADEEISIDMDGQTKTLKLYDERICMNLRIVKKDSDTGRPLAGALYTLSDMNGHMLSSLFGTGRMYCETDENGSILFEGLPCGRYILKEVGAPDGYILSEDETTVILMPEDADKDDPSTVTVELFNIQKSVYMPVMTGDEDNTAMAAGISAGAAGAAAAAAVMIARKRKKVR